MRCSKCDSDNREGRKFCAACGVPLVVTCAKCGATNQPEERFCGDCGSALSTNNAAAQSPAFSWSVPDTAITAEQTSAAAIADGERKTVTALFADIKGSTELMRSLDPEEARAIIDPALKLMIDAVHRYEGYVVQSTGDGIFALFGAPVAHEDHPQRAVHAAIATRDELLRRGEELRMRGGALVEVRIGINTGEVVMRTVQTGGHTEYTPIGHVINLAARMQTVAPGGGIVVSDDTRRLVEGYFELHELLPTEVKGVSQPIKVYEVVGVGALRGHFDVAARRGLTKFVGRERELQQIRYALDLAMTGHGQLVAVLAEAGTGKSRLFHEFKAMLPPGCKVLEAYSVSHGKASAWLPVLELLRGYFSLRDVDAPASWREEVRARIAALDPAISDVLPYLSALLGIQTSPDPIAQTDPQIRRQRTLDGIKRIVLRETLNQPTVVIFEDLHWIDSETQALLDVLADGIVNARILLLVNYRPEYRHEWSGRSHYLQLRLDPLVGENAAAMLEALLGSCPDLDSLKRLIAERTGGNPFFMEEMVQALFEQGILERNGAVNLVRPLSQAHMPVTVQGILAARIDRLTAKDKELLQILAVVGNKFSLTLAKQISQMPDEDLELGLANLRLGEFIYEQPALAHVQYAFKHALTHEVAYNSLLIERRKQLHERTAQTIEAVYSQRLEDHYADLAYHYRSSDNSAKAVEYCLRACQQSMDRASYAEAIGHFDHGLARLHELPDDDRRAELELDLRNAARGAVITIKGVTEAEQFALRAFELSRRPGVHSEKAWRALNGLYATAQTRGGVERLRELGAELLAIAEQSGNVDFTAESFYRIAFMHLVAGDFELAAKSFDRSISLFETRTSQPSLAWAPSYAHAYAASAWLSWLLGFPDRALKLIDNALAVARASDSKAGEQLVRTFSARVFLYRRDLEQTRQSAGAAIALATELGDPFRRALGELFLGWSYSVAQEPREGLARMQRALTELGRTGSLTMRSDWLSPIAEVQCLLAQYDNASVAIDDALASMEQTGERAYEAEVRRTKGELLRAKGSSNAPQAEQSFRTAIEIARRQKARGWELRATTSLARLLRDTNRREEARAMLAEIYNWFTEGFDTADLKEAKALLDELSA